MDVRRIFSGLNVIAIGLILLANTLGYLPWSVWWNILSLWPLLLVAAGLDMLGKAFEWPWVRAVSGLVVLAGLAFGALVLPAGGAAFPGAWSLGSGEGVVYEQSVPQQGNAMPASLKLSEGASNVSIGPTDSSLVSIKGRASRPVPRLQTTVSSAVTEVTISREPNGGPVLGGSTMTVGMSRTAAWREVAIAAGASSVEADLSELPVALLSIKTGATTVAATLGSLTDCEVEVSAGASSIEFDIPDDARVRVISDSALVGADLPGFERTSRMGFGHTEWVYAPKDRLARVDITIKVSMGVGSLSVTTYPAKTAANPLVPSGVTTGPATAY